MFQIELLPAAHGDALWIECGDDPRRPTRIVIDGGPASTYEKGLRERLLKLDPDDRRIDLFVVSHIDADHIDGAIIFLREAKELGISLGEVWFNGWPQLAKVTAEGLQPIQGEFLGALLATSALTEWIWNTRTRGEAVVVPDEGPLPSWEVGGATLTLLSPGVKQLRRLRARWSAAIREFSPGDTNEALKRLAERREYRPPPMPPVFGGRSYGDDRGAPNGSSIAFLLEQGGVSCLLAADAHARVLAGSLARLIQSRSGGRGGRIALDAVKLPHHGSLGNVNEEMLSQIDCPLWLISTNGAIFGHPDLDTAKLVAKTSPGPPTFLCNYRSPTTERFAGAGSSEGWETRYPGDRGSRQGPSGGLLVELKSAKGRKRRKR